MGVEHVFTFLVRGWATSAVLGRALIPYVDRQIHDAVEKVWELSPGAVDAAITAAFLRLDDEIISDGLRALTDAQTESEAVSRTAPARAGSCALLAVLDPRNSLLRVTCVGDSRAVLGRQSSPGTDRITIPLSKDHTGFDEEEVARLANEHPGETDIIDPKSGRLLGLAVTRPFGDHRWKWPATAIQQWSETHFGSGPRPNYKSPPYMSAEPVITTTKIETSDFVILASDGLWDRISSEDAVRCVSMWLERRPSKGSAAISEAHNAGLGFPKSKVTPGTFVVEDDNVATHLTRNALGGKRRDLFCAEMSLQAPDSRHERDDITVQVIFFGPLDRDAKAKL
jgi:pyruvate dehydrogenase phosphatase